MLFSSIPFLYYFLPIVFLVYFAVPKSFKNFVLLVASLFFYGCGEPKYLILMSVSILIGYGGGFLTGHAKKKGTKRVFLTLSVVLLAGLLGYFKYADFFIANFNALTGLSLPLLRVTLPIGISFYTFQILSYVVDVYRGDTPAQKNLITFAAYVSMFPQLIAGPIVRYTDVERELETRTHSVSLAYDGVRRFLVGLSKKILLANLFAELCDAFRASDEKSVLFHWLYAVGFTMLIYFDFSGYSDMAIGLGKIMGFRFPENFNYPYLSGSVTEFWRRWHMTLGTWFRDYVYIPLGGNRVPFGRWIFNIAVVWFLTGLWHGAAWNFVLWGLMFAVLLVLEKLFLKKWLEKLPVVLAHTLVMVVIIISFVLFNASSLAEAASDMAGMFGLGGLPLVTAETLYYLRSYAVIFVFGIIGCTPLPANIAKRLADGTKTAGVFRVLEVAVLAGLLLVCTAFLVDGSFNPFLYFRF